MEAVQVFQNVLLLCRKPVLAGQLLKIATQFIAATLRLQVTATMDASKNMNISPLNNEYI